LLQPRDYHAHQQMIRSTLCRFTKEIKRKVIPPEEYVELGATLVSNVLVLA
jgi:hypothetical protein